MSEITSITLKHPTIGTVSFNGKVEFGKPNISPDKTNFDLLMRWNTSGRVSISKNEAKRLKRLLNALKSKKRLPRKYKKLIKADIHCFFEYQHTYNISTLIKWHEQFKGKLWDKPSRT